METRMCDLCDRVEGPYDIMRETPTFHRLTHFKFRNVFRRNRPVSEQLDLCPECFASFRALCQKSRDRAES